MVYLILGIGVVITLLGAARLRNVPLRRLAAYDAMGLRVSEAVEDNRGVHLSIGSSAIHDTSALTAIAATEVAYIMAIRAALADKPITISLSDAPTLGVVQDRLRRAYKIRNSLGRFQQTMTRWYPQGTYSLAFGAGVGINLADQDASTVLLAGRFGAELALIAESAARGDRALIAHSTDISGQAVAFAASETPLLGEELFAGGAYLDGTPLSVAGAVLQDLLRIAVIIVVLSVSVLAFFGAIQL
jgi:hypothetical protein